MKSSPVFLLMILLLAASALAGPAVEKPGEMSACCIEAAQAAQGCCGKDAETVKAAYADYQAVQAARAELHPCCLTALDEGKGCCGKDAEALKAGFQEKVALARQAAPTKGEKADGCTESMKAKSGCSESCTRSKKVDDKKI